MSFTRRLNVADLLRRTSFFLLGPRATGKSWLVREQLGDRALVLDLLRSDLALRLSADPGLLEAIVGERRGRDAWVVIDEIQKVPALLDEVHRLIEERGLRFVLTGSSARKLRRGGVNLLAGRAWRANLFPLVSAEQPDFDLARQLRFGGLPMVVASEEPDEELRAYVGTYLREEIQAEGLVRRLPQFARFLETAALTNGQMLNFAQIASDAGMPAATVREHYRLLEDTLVGFLLPAWTRSRRRKAISTARFWFFDPGVAHTLAGTRALDRNSDLYGLAFEHWVVTEVRAWLSYRRRTDPLAYWRSTHQHEVDLVVGDHSALEAKATRSIRGRDLRGVRALREEGLLERYLVVSEDPVETSREGLRCLHWRTFVDELWSDRLFA